MSLNSELLAIAENHIRNDFYGRKDVKHSFLHKLKSPDVIITINGNANVEKIEKNKDPSAIPMPITPEAIGRGHGHVFPAALHEQLRYVSKNMEYSEEKGCNPYFDAYITNLKKWQESNRDKRLLLLIKYLEKGSIDEDIKSSNIKAGSKTNIAFNFILKGKINNPWEDEDLIDDFIKYELSILEKEEEGAHPCYITGRRLSSVIILPRGFYGFGWKSHYLCQKDTKKVVYHGIHHSSDEAAHISNYASYCIFWALDYLLRFHSVRYRKSSYILASTNNEIEISLDDDIGRILNKQDSETITLKEIKDHFDSMKDKLLPNSKMLYLSIGSMSDARLTIRRYQQFIGRDCERLIDSYMKWHIEANAILEHREPLYRYDDEMNIIPGGYRTTYELALNPFGVRRLIYLPAHGIRGGRVVMKERKGDEYYADAFFDNMLMNRNLSQGFINRAIDLIDKEGYLSRYDNIRTWPIHELCSLVRLQHRKNDIFEVIDSHGGRHCQGRIMALADRYDSGRMGNRAYHLSNLIKKGRAPDDDIGEKILERAKMSSRSQKEISYLRTLIVKSILEERIETKNETIIGYEYEINNGRRGNESKVQ